MPYYVWLTPEPHWGFKWINHALSYLGYARDKWDGCFDMANNMRKTYNAEWGYSVFVVMDENDEFHRFTDGRFAYVASYDDLNWMIRDYNNQCFVVMTYNNGGHGIRNMNEVFRHETAHIFRAADEYYEAGYGGCQEDDCENEYGYLQVVNGNCDRCNPNYENCVMHSSGFNVFCDYSLGQIGWRDTDGDGPADPVDPNDGGWMSIINVQPGDLIKIFTIDGDFANLISVTSNNLFTESTPAYVIWNGHNFDGQKAAAPQNFLVSVNDGPPTTRYLNPGNPSADIPNFNNISYQNSRLNWELKTSWAYVRCFIYDESENLVSRLVWDKLYSPNYLQINKLDLIPSGQTYTAKFYAWRPDGAGSQTVEYQFYHGCQGECGDVNADGHINVSDAIYMINYVFTGGPPPQPVLACGDANTDGKLNSSDAVYIINFVFVSGAPPGDCSPDAFPDAPCCPYEE